MAKKSQRKLINILVFTALLLLVATAAVVKINWKSLKSVLVPTAIDHDQFPSQFLFAIPARNGTTFIYPTSDLLDDHKIATIQRDDAIHSNTTVMSLISSKDIRYCTVPYPNFRATMRRSSRNTVLFVANENQSDGISMPLWGKLVLFNTKNCNNNNIYYDPVPTNLTIFTNDNSTDERFAVLMNGKKYCHDHEWCRLFIEPRSVNFEPLVFDFEFSMDQLHSIEMATSFDGDQFVVRYTDDVGTHRVRLYDMEPNGMILFYMELFNMPNYERVQLISSGLSYCWLRIPESQFIYCSKFATNGRLIFNQTIVNHENFTRLIKVVTVPNGLILFSFRCSQIEMMYDECTTVEVTLIEHKPKCNNTYLCSSVEFNSHLLDIAEVKDCQYKLKCDSPYRMHNVKLAVQASDSGDSFEVQYLCDRRFSYAYAVLSIKYEDFYKRQ